MRIQSIQFNQSIVGKEDSARFPVPVKYVLPVGLTTVLNCLLMYSHCKVYFVLSENIPAFERKLLLPFHRCCLFLFFVFSCENCTNTWHKQSPTSPARFRITHAHYNTYQSGCGNREEHKKIVNWRHLKSQHRLLELLYLVHRSPRWFTW